MNKQSEKLAKAIAYEAKKKKERDEDKRPAFHVTPTTGWCNDPNGFSRFGEEYHLFYQYYPYENKWGPMHWGHCRTKDFIKWEELPCALAPVYKLRMLLYMLHELVLILAHLEGGTFFDG